MIRRLIYFAPRQKTRASNYIARAKTPVEVCYSPHLLNAFSAEFEWHIFKGRYDSVDQMLRDVPLETTFLERMLEKTRDDLMREKIIMALNQRYCQY